MEAAPPAARAAEPLALQESMGLYFVWRRVPNRVPNLFGRRAAPRAAEPLALQESRAVEWLRSATSWSGTKEPRRSGGGGAAAALQSSGRQRRCGPAVEPLRGGCGVAVEQLRRSCRAAVESGGGAAQAAERL